MNQARNLAFGLVCLAAMAVPSAFAAGTLPSGYTEIEYIQGNGSSARIVTDYTPNPTTDKIELVAEWPSGTLNANQAVWCARGSDTTVKTWTLFMLNQSSNKFRFDYNANVDTFFSNPVAVDTKYTVTVDGNVATWDGPGTGCSHTAVPSFTAAGGPVVLFASYTGAVGSGTTFGNYGKQKLYSFKVWRSGKLIHYFVPCKDSGGAATMVDICDNPATLSRSGTFTAGGEGHYFDDSLFTIPDDTLVIVGTSGNYGSPSPAYGMRTGLAAGDSFAVSCGATVLTNGTTECIYQGWKLYDSDGNVLTNGLEASFTYTHPTPAKGRRLAWQWKTRPVGADATDLLPTLCMTFNSQSLANTGTGTLTMKDKGTPTYVPSVDGYALDARVYTPWGDSVSGVITGNRDSSIAVVAALGTTSCGILVHFRNSSNNAGIVLRRGTVANQVVLTQGNSTTALITVNDIENADIDYHLYVANILASGVELYIDGELAGTTASTPRANAMNSMQIGSRHGNVISPEAIYGGGRIDDVRVYASALSTEQMKALGQSLGIISPIKILPIPEQVCTIVDTPKPGFTVTNVETGAFWDFGEGGVASGETPFDVAYSFTNGYGTVTVTGKAEGEYEGEMVKRSYELNNELLVNGGFESGDWAPGWTASGNYAKIDTSGSAYGPNQTTTFISGSYCAILQKQNVATQVFTNDSPYCAELSWKCKQRSGYSGIPYEVSIDGNRIFYENFPTSSSEVHYRTVEDVLLPPGEHTLKFETFATADRTLFLDDVSLKIVSKRCVAALPIPDQFYGAVGDCRPEFMVSNVVNAQTWTLGGDIVSADFDVAYSNNVGPGVATVTVTGKGDLSDNVFTTTFKIYGRVKSITSTGTQYINTGIVPGLTTAVEMHFCATNNGASTSFFGAGRFNQASSYCLFQNGMYYFIGKNGTSLRYLYEAGVDTVISINTNAADNCCLNVGGNIATSTISLAYTGSYNLHIFASSGGEQKSKFTLYSFKMWKDGELVRDFVPVRSESEVGLWDFVTSTFFKNIGTGSFVAGPDETDIVVAKIPNQFYTGAALTPDVVVSNLAGTARLAKNVDYTVAYEDNAAVGTGKAIVTGIGAYSSVVTNEFAIYAVPAASAFTSSAYIQNGLMNHWDAIDNTGTGTFDPAARTWKDLKGNLDFTLTDRADWGGGFLETHGCAGIANDKTGKYLTMEIKYRSTNSRLGMPFFSGYGWNRVAWYRFSSQLWFHHRTAETRNTLTGMATPDATDREIAVVYGSGDAPRWFYEGGVPRTSGISNQMFNTGELDWVTSFTRASIGGASETQYNYDGRLYSIRLYDCPLSEKEIAYNAAVDKVRYEGVAPAEAFNSSDMRWNETSGKVEVLINLALVNGIGRLSINGGGASAWVSHGDEVKIEYKPVGDEKALEWFGLPGGAPRSADLFTVTFTAEAPVAATLQMLKKVDATRVLNADPGIEEGSGSFPVSWNRTADRAWIGGHGAYSDERGMYYLYPYQGNIFFQEGLALPAGTYTLSFDHAAVTDGLVYYWRLYDATNGVHSICNITNDVGAYGTSWRTVQTDFTIAEDGIYKLQTGMAAGGGNCYISFDNVSISSDTDLHVEVEKCYPYLGEAQVRPPVVVRDDEGNILTEGVDYELLYGANNSPGFKLDTSVSLRHGNGYVAAKGIGTHYGVAGANFRLGMPIYVKPDGLPTNGGTSWADAVDFETALTLAASTNINHEIWIAGSNVLTSAAVSRTFYGNKIFRGGFKGTESTIEEREEGAYSTIDGDDQFSAVVFKSSHNIFFERLRFRGSPARAVSKTGSGGDVFIDDCVFEENGNALYVQGVDRSPYDQGSVFVKNSVFRNNSSTDAADGSAALYSYQTRRVSVENSLFVGNTLATSSKVKTSAIFANSSAIALKGCDFVGNIGSGSTYGTVRASGINALNTIENCLFRGNQTDGANGAAATIVHSSLAGRTEIVNSTFAANANATAGGCAGVKMTTGTAKIRNSIFHGNGGTDFADSANASCDVDYTLLANDTDATHSFVHGSSKLGGSMVYGDPLFAAADDCHLLSEAGYFDSEGNLHYAAAGVRSPAIDAGDPASDYSRESAPNGGCVNLGRYGNTAEASRTPSASPAVDAPTIAWNDPDGYTMPTVSFTMGGSGSYTAHGIVYVSTDGGATWVDVSGTIGGLVNGQTKVFRIPAYYVPRSTIRVKVVVSGSGQVSESAVASSTVPASLSLPPWYNKKGPNNVIHMRPGAIGRNDGTSWTDAFASWADALAAASSLKNEIWVAGTNIVTETIPTKAFTFPAVIRGGFTGVECALSERPEGHRSVIDGQNNFDTFNFSNTDDLLVDSIEFLRGAYRGLKKNSSAGDVTLTNCVFYGCTIGKGNWDGNGNSNISYQYGGGGAGLYGSGSAKATVVDCRFEGNIINSAGGNGGFGGGLYVGNFGGGADIYRCSFVTNYMQRNFDSSRASMAALHVYNTRATVDGCSFYGHYAEGIADVHGSCSGSVFRRCSFVGNYGGGSGVLSVKLNNTTDKALIENCTFAYNVSHGLNCVKGATAVTNCIFYGNLAKANATAAADLRVAADATATVDYCLFAVPEEDGSTICVSEVTAGSLQIGPNCIYGNPLFETPTNTVMADVHSPAGATMPRALPTDWNWTWRSPVPTFAQAASYDAHLRSHFGYMLDGVPHKHFKENSPAIDAGDPKSDYSLEPWIPGMGYHGGRINLGAYGNTREAAMSPFRASMLILR